MYVTLPYAHTMPVFYVQDMRDDTFKGFPQLYINTSLKKKKVLYKLYIIYWILPFLITITMDKTHKALGLFCFRSLSLLAF